MPLETPSLENLSVLTGKYGEEGDQLLFKVLNSGDFLSKTSADDYAAGSRAMVSKISKKGLRYDLTVPFARYVVMNQHNLALPFKRYQIQPVWRADRPQKGRYQEFYQCDADVVGTNSLICEAEIIAMINEVFDGLGLQGFSIKINNRKILTGITEKIGASGKESELCVAIDKLDKIGEEKVFDELKERGFTQENLDQLAPVFKIEGSNAQILDYLGEYLQSSDIGTEGVEEMRELLEFTGAYDKGDLRYSIDVTLARGLSYYTGTIFEVKPTTVAMGSICGGGRYDDLTGAFGMNDVSGVGISFGIERIYDVLEELKLFPDTNQQSVQVMIVNFGGDTTNHALKVLGALRNKGLNAEIYPDSIKMKKQLNYANKKLTPYVLLIGSDEVKEEVYTLKDMNTGDQHKAGVDEICEIVQRS